MNDFFESEHLKFRSFQMEDAHKLYENHLEEELKQWIPNESYVDIEEAEDAIGFYMDCANKKELPFVLAIESKETGELIGDTGANEVDGKDNEVEIGFSICKRYSGNGYATEAATAMTNYVADAFGISILYGRVMKGNAASCKVMEKAGYTFSHEERDAEDDPYGKGMLIYRKVL